MMEKGTRFGISAAVLETPRPKQHDQNRTLLTDICHRSQSTVASEDWNSRQEEKLEPWTNVTC